MTSRRNSIILAALMNIFLFCNPIAWANCDGYEMNKAELGHASASDLHDFVLGAIDARRWDSLEETGTRYRDEKKCFSDGSSAYQGFYNAMESYRKLGDDERFAFLLTNLDAWIEDRPKSTIAKLMKANAFQERAWILRRGDYANEVTAQGWKDFDANMEAAASIYESLFDAGVEDPFLYSELISCAGIGGLVPESTAFYYERAMQYDPDYFRSSLAMASKAHPRWGGSFRALRRLAEDAGDSHSEALYFRIANYVKNHDGWDDFKACGFDHERLKSSFGSIPESAPGYAWHLIQFAYIACEARDQEAALAAMLKLEEMGCSNWWTSEGNFQRWLSWAKNEGPVPGPSHLHVAAKHANFPDAEKLLEQGVDIDARDEKGFTALLTAITNKRHAMAMMLLERGANPDIPQYGGRNPLMMAVDRGKPELISALLEAGADPMQRAGSGWTALHLAAQNETPEALEILLKDPGIDPDARTDDHNFTALLAATGYAREDCAMRLIQDGRFDPTAKDNDHYTPLLHASQRGLARVVEALLRDTRVDVNVTSRKAVTPLMAAVYKSNVKVVEKLLEAPGIDVNHESRSDGTALHYAAYNNDRGMTYILVTDKRVDVNIKSRRGETPLHVAAKHDALEAAQLIVQRPEIVLGVKNSDGKTELEVAEEYKHPEMVRFFKELQPAVSGV